ncbi:MAG: terminase large subunit domain-containing protein [bacterium]
MKRDRYDKLKKLIEVSRYYPVIGAEKLLNIRLPDYQKDILERLWKKKHVVLLCSRRTGKTFTTAVYLTLKAMLYPYAKIGILAPVFRQAQTVFLEVEDLYKRSEFLRIQCNYEPKHGSTEWHIGFNNSSRISAMPFSDKIRSKGFNIVFIDEYAYGDEMNNKLKNIVIPMIFVKRDVKTNFQAHSTDIGNQVIQASTASFKWNDFYELVTEYDEKIQEGNKDYDIISYDYRDGLRSGIFEEDLVLEEFKNADSLTQDMEYLNIFPDEKGGFISYKLLHDKAFDFGEKVNESKGEYTEPKTQVELEQELDKQGLPKYEYIVAIDDADQGQDNFAVAIIKLDGYVKRLVRVEALNNAPIQEKIRLLRKILRKYNVIQIVADQRHKNIKDNLAEPYTYSDGRAGEVIVDIDDDEQLRYVKNAHGSDCNYKKLLKIHNFSGSSNETRARHFLAEIEKGRFKIPVDPKGGYKSKKEEKVHNEIKKTIQEITSIIPKPSGRFVKYEPETRAQTKDRWTVCELGCYMADQYLKDDTVNDFVIGV